mgnify:CR=1 FL=1
MMLDRVRMNAYRAAIDMRCPGKVICEIGVGLGPLSLMALQAGAERVYGIEVDEETLQLAVEVLRSNGFGADRFVPICGMSTEVDLPERVDVILSETLDSTGIGENTAHFMADAKHRFLKAGGCFLPEKLDCYVALASPNKHRDEVRQWNDDLKEFGLDFSAVLPTLRHSQQIVSVSDAELFSEWIPWQAITFDDPSTFQNLAGVAAQGHREGTITGIAMAFDATLAPGIHIRTFPQDPETHWKQGFCAFPTSPVEYQIGDVVYVELHLAAGPSRCIEMEQRVVSGPAEQVIAYIRQRIAETSPAEEQAAAAPG